MFYQECERLACEKPALEGSIAKIDALLHRVNKNGLFRPDEIASSLKERPSQVLGILKTLCSYELLREVTYFECSACGNLVSTQDFEESMKEYGQYQCSQCMKTFGDDLRKNPAKVYELNPLKDVGSKSFRELPKPLKVFYCYAHEDEELRKELEKHLSLLKRQGLIQDWHDRKLLGGSYLDSEIDVHLDEAHIVLLLISSDFLSSDYCYSVEMEHALAKHSRNETRVIPIIIRECDWSQAPFAELVALPRDGIAVTSKKWTSTDEAFTDVAKGIRKVVCP